MILSPGSLLACKGLPANSQFYITSSFLLESFFQQEIILKHNDLSSFASFPLS